MLGQLRERAPKGSLWPGSKTQRKGRTFQQLGLPTMGRAAGEADVLPITGSVQAEAGSWG